MRVMILATIALIAACSLACGGGGGSADLTPKSMPPGGSFTGVWFSPQYGEMHLEQSGSAVVGTYSKQERSGRIQGTAQGDVLRFAWTEEREMVVGHPSTTRGQGYFRYVIGADGKHNLLGEWGVDDENTGGGPWNAYKLRNRRPQVAPPESTGESRPAAGDDHPLDDAPADGDRAPGPPTGADQDVGGDDALRGLDEY